MITKIVANSVMSENKENPTQSVVVTKILLLLKFLKTIKVLMVNIKVMVKIIFISNRLIEGKVKDIFLAI
mgnify:CR=1 FL=1